MKKVIFSILIASYAICSMATTPIDKLPAIVIDTLYEAKGSLVVEYEVLRPFDRVYLTVQTSWEQATKGVMPVSLSGNPGKGKTSVSISLMTDEATHFNVFIAGSQFADKSDTLKYDPGAYNYAIFSKQKDGTVKQFRTIFTEEEIVQIAERIKTMIFVDQDGQLVDVDGVPVTTEQINQFRETAAQRYEEPLGVNVVRRNIIVDMPDEKNDSTDGSSRSVKTYNFNISGNVRTASDPNTGWGTYIPATRVVLFFFSHQ